MTARSNYLGFLDHAGFTPNRALLFEEGSGVPIDHYTANPVTPQNSPGWATDSTYGPVRAYSGTTQHDDLDPASQFLTTGSPGDTVLIIRRKTDTTVRNTYLFAENTADNTARCSSHFPESSDGIVKFDYGGVSAPNRLPYSPYTVNTNWEALAFRAGPGGSSIWKNGIQVASQGTALTRTSTGGVYQLNAGPFVNGDLLQVAFWAHVSGEVSDAVLATFTVDTVLLGFPAPSITTTSPLPAGQKDVAYTTTFSAVSGTPPYVWSVVSGAVPGLSINSSTGVYSGTPSAAALYHLVIAITDNNATTTQGTFDLYIDDPACTPQAIGSLARGSFSHNSRVGPHDNGAKKLALIFRDADNLQKLNANWSTDNGVSWSTVTTAALSNTIASHDSHHADGSDTIHVWTQEAVTGRVAYHTFSLGMGVWTLFNNQWSAANTIINGAVSGTVLSPSGSPAVAYESNKENVGGDRARMTYNDKIGGVLGTPLPLGDIGIAQSDLFGRLIAGGSNRSTMIMTVDPGYSVLSTRDFQLQIIRSNRTLSAISVFRTTNLLGTVPDYFLGNYTTYNDGANLILVVPVKLGGTSTIFSFIDSDTPATASLGEPDLNNFVGQGSFVPIVARHILGQLHFLDFAWPDLFSDSFIRHKSGASNLGPFTPANMASQTGPLMGVITGTTQTMDGNIVARTCQGVDSVYVMTAVPIGTIDGITQTVKFEWLNISDLPSSPALTLAQWLSDLTTQRVTFCCNNISGGTCTHPLYRTDEYAAQSFSAGYEQSPSEPYSYSVSVTPPAQLRLIPPPDTDGTLDLCTVNTGPTLGLNPDLPVVLGIPDDLCWAVKWGVLAQLLSSDGDARDPARSKAAQDLYDLGVSLGRHPISTLMVQVDGGEVPVGAIADFDQYNPEWQCVQGRPSQAAMIGANLLAFGGDSNPGTGIPDSIYAITMDLARSFPVPDPADPNNTYIQLGQELLNAILDMAQHIASFKMAGPEFNATLELRNNFLKACARVNGRLRSNAVYNALLTQPAARQDFKIPVVVPRDESSGGSGRN